ncbi:hypothetical protein FA95DRAFT_1593917 [Auriscalpium vulgare]|uniref:Uncharacterized protein n=1 Tax=Auriscalpium vulgare TaxID=40419 RepID=A0ACB8S2D6_9AGAM|nr:hypothetical protein FA95DRAFT_1593917 [Auriscalpium vulgare]
MASKGPRRGNKSHKVPGVKLRPVQPSTKAAALSHRRRTPSPPPDSFPYREEFETSFIDPCPRPFKGVLLCATGIDKSELFVKALQLGANTTSDFIDTVTHLIANDHGSPKYLCALERNIPILKPSWILDNFEIWQKGDDFDFEESLAQHRLPIFSDVVLSISGIENVTLRTEINRVLTQEGGKYEKDLGRPVRVTHILCSGNEETDKMKYARKFNSQREANIRLVWEEWFWDCLEFGGRFDEKEYLVTHPRPARKQLPPPPPAPPSILAAMDTASTSSVPGISQPNPNPIEGDNPLLDEEEVASARRHPAAALQVWESLLGSRGFIRVGRELVRTASAGLKDSEGPGPSSPPAKLDKGKGKALPSAQVRPTERLAGASHSGLSTFTRTKSFAPQTTDALAPGPSKQPFRTNSTMFKGARALPLPRVDDEQLGKSSNEPRIFDGLRFRVRGEARSPTVQEAIDQRGGICVEALDEDEYVDFVIVRLFSGSRLYMAEPDEALRGRYRTECWLEACLDCDRICSPDEHPSFVPVGIPVNGVDQIVLSHSGLNQLEAMWLKRLSSTLGMSYAPIFNRGSTHLLCESEKGAKFDKAREWGVPVVNLRWLSALVATGAVPEDESRRSMENNESAGPVIDITNDPAPGSSQRRAESSLSVNKQGVVRAATVLVPPVEESLFGPPVHGLLEGASKALPPRASASMPALSRSSTGRRSPSFPLSAQASVILPSDPVSRSQPAEGSDTEEEDEAPSRVPSSSTPSPLKMPSSGLQREATMSSPLRPVVSDAGARALQESISNLLGKRTSMDDSEPVSHKRPGKRARPRSKPQSRKDSANADVEHSGVAGSKADLYNASYTYSEDIGFLKGQQLTEESGMIIYEDPAQQAGRQRLMSLIGEGKQSVVEQRVLPTARETRGRNTRTRISAGGGS